MTPAALLLELSSAGFLLYPTRFPEIGCITVMKAMAMGCIPITSRYVNSVLRPIPHDNENATRGVGITADFDLGPILPFMDNYNYTLWLENHWVPAVIAAHNRGVVSMECASLECPDGLSEHRLRMQQYAISTFSWKSSAKLMTDIFFV